MRSIALRLACLAALLSFPSGASAQSTGDFPEEYLDATKVDGARSSNYAVASSNLLLASQVVTGAGADGACVVTSGTVNLSSASCSERGTADMVSWALATRADAGQRQLSLPSTTGLAVGDEVLIIALQLTGAGTWETRRIESISGTVLTVTSSLASTFDPATTRVLVQRIPNYSSVTVASGAALTANAFNGSTGGVFFMRSTGSVTLDGTISMSGRGYRGTPGLPSWGGGYRGENAANVYGTVRSPSQSWGGGGGGDAEWCHSGNGGAGGGYGTAGANGGAAFFSCGGAWSFGYAVAQGGQPYGAADLSQLFMGAGGGGGGVDGDNPDWGGLGSAGGGIVIVEAGSLALTATGRILSQGNAGGAGPGETGGGGGGAGGSILLRAHNLVLGSSQVLATGGAGGPAGPDRSANSGGAGGAGRIAIVHGGLIGTTSPAANTQAISFGTSGYATSVNLFELLPGKSRPSSLTYTLSSLPEGASATLQLSPDGGATWYDDFLTQDSAIELFEGGPQTIELSGFDEWYSDFRIRVSLASDGTASPALDSWALSYENDGQAPSGIGQPVADPNPANGEVSLSWEPAIDEGSGFDHYELQVSSDGGNTWTLIDSPESEAASYDPAEGSYLFRVRAVDVAGNVSDWSAVSDLLLVDLTAPGIPAVPSASPNPSQPGTIEVSWAPVADSGGAGLAGYLVEMSADGGDSWTELEATTETTIYFEAEQGHYWFHVQALDNAGNGSDWSESSAELIVDGTAPSIPGAPSASPSPSNGSVTVSWGASTDSGGSGLSHYELEASTDAGETWSLLRSGAPTSQTLSLAQGIYRLRVRAVDAVGNASDWSPETPLIVDTTAPAAPSKPVATPNPSDGGSVRVGWTAATDAGGSGVGSYELEVSSDGGSTWTGLTSTPATSLNYAPTEGRYLFRVRVADHAGNVSAWSVLSDELLVDTTAPAVPGQPIASPSPSPVAQVRLSWSASSDAGAGLTGYVLEMSSDGGSSWASLAAPAAPEHAFTPAQGRYVFRAAAVDAVGNQSAWSPLSAELVVDGAAPSVPTALVASPSPARAEVTVSWSASTDTGGSGLAGYSLEISADAGSSWSELTSGTATSHAFSPAQGSYQLRVRASDAVGNPSAWSAPASLLVDKTAPSIPGQPIAAPAVSAGGPVGISWTGSTDTGGSSLATYELELAKDGGAWAAVASTAATDHSFSPTQGSYQLRVRALDGAGNASAWSPLGSLLVDSTPPPAPGRPVGTPNPSANEPIALSWTASVDTGGSGLASYRLERSADGTAWTTIATPATNSAIDPVGSGTWLYRVAALDGAGNLSGWSEASAPVVVTGKPVADDGSATTEEDMQVAIGLSARDPDGDALGYTIVSGPAHGALSGSAPAMTYTPAPDYSGEDSFTFEVSDGTWTSSLATVRITVQPVDDAPLAIAQELQTDEDAPLALTLAGHDVEGDSLAFEIVDAPQHGALSGQAPDLVYTPAQDFNGDELFTFRVRAGALESEPAEVRIAVAPVNDAPVAQAAALSLDEGSTLQLSLAATDVDGDTLEYRVSLEPANGTLSGTAPDLTYAPNAGFNGTDTLQFVANDGQVDSEEAAVTVETRNLPPVLAAAGDDLSPEEGQVVRFAANASDPGGDALSFAWDFGDGSTSTEEDPSHLFAIGTFTVTVTADDGEGGSTSQTLTVVVGNAAPMLQIASDKPVAFEGETVHLTANGFDPGGDALSYHWSFGDGSESFEQNPAYAWRNQGTFAVTAIVDDGNGGTAEQSLTIEVQNAAPAAEIVVDDPSPVEGRSVQLQALASDPGLDDALRFAWSFGDGASATEREPAHTWANDGSYEVVLVVTDSDGASKHVSTTVQVANAPPEIALFEVPAAGNEASAISVSASATDLGVSDTLTYSWSWGDGTQGSVGSSASHAYADNGSFTVTLTVADDAGASAVRSLEVQVANLAPAASDPGRQTVEAGETLELTLQATDPAGAADPLSWTLVAGPGQLSGDGRYSYAPAADVVATWQVTAEVSDGDSGTAQVSFEVEVLARDGDDDGVADSTDNCPTVANPDQADTDGDGHGDACSDDSDGDEVVDVEDNCPLVANADQADQDADGAGDLCDEDRDGDGLSNEIEASIGTDPASRDSDADTIADGEEVGDAEQPSDTDNDGTIDALDADSDGDGLTDAEEAGDADLDTPAVDTDGDTVPDYRDDDSDGDGVLDRLDLCPVVIDADQSDLDGDGLGDLCDGDRDGDGSDDASDSCPGVANPDQADADHDGAGDPCDGDRDGDGLSNESDSCPDAADDGADVDSDGIANVCDPTDDRAGTYVIEDGCGCSSGAEGATSLLGILAAGLSLIGGRRRRHE